MDYIDRLKSVCCTLIDEAQPIVCHDDEKEYVVSEETMEELRIALANLEIGEFI